MGEEQAVAAPETIPSSPVNVAGTTSTHRAIELVSSIIFLSHSIKVFAVKWQMIRSKLEELHAALIALQNCDSGEDPAVLGLISAITATSRDCRDLARRCLALSFSGKLLMQSDLDVMAAKFDQFIKKLAGIYTAWVLSHGFAIVVSRPGIGACKDDLRFYVGDLLTRMKIGDAVMKRQALANLRAVVAVDGRYVKILAETDDVVLTLAKFLDSPGIHEESAKLVSLLAGFGSFKSVLVGAGIIAPLIRVLETGTDDGKEAAARSLQRLTENSDNAWSVSAHGGVTALLKISGAGGKTELIVSASGVLRNLLGIVEIKRFMIEEGAISTFIKLVNSKAEILQIHSIEFLQNIAAGDDSIRQLIVREGGVRALVRVLDSNSKPSLSSKPIETSLRAIETLCFTSMNSITTLISYGFVHRLLLLLRSGEPSVQEQSLKIAHKLSNSSEEARKRMGDSGFMIEFVRLLGAKSYEVREMAAAALASTVAVARNRKRFLEDDRNVEVVMQMLEGKSGNKKWLLSTLMSLTRCNSGRKKIASSGLVKNIEKLAEAQVSDAMRLVRKLSGGRFRSMLGGLWHS